MSADQSHAKMGAFVKNKTLATHASVPWEQRESIANSMLMSASLTLASMEIAQMASTATTATATMGTQEGIVTWILMNALARHVKMEPLV